MKLLIDSTRLFSGAETRIVVEARDEDRNLVNSFAANVTTSNASVVAVAPVEIMTVKDSAGRDLDVLTRRLLMMREGSAVIRTEYSGHSDSILVTVVHPPVGAALVFASFEVIEYGEDCAHGPCPHLRYAPLLKLQEPSGVTSVSVLGLRLDVGHLTTGWCGLYRPVELAAGLSVHVNNVQPYFYDNDFLMWVPGAVPVADTPVSAKLIVQREGGVTDTVMAQGKIVRNVTQRRFPEYSGYQVIPTGCQR